MKQLIAFVLALSLLLGMTAAAEGVTLINTDSNTASSLGGETELIPGETIKVDGDYSISFASAKIYSNTALAADWHFVYMESKENGAETVRFESPVGTHTAGRLRIKLINRSKENVNWLDRVKCTIVYDDLYSFDTLAVQYNPDQTRSDGKTGYGSTVAVDAEPLMAIEVGFLFSVPYAVRDYDGSLIAYVTIDQDTYAVDLRSCMEIDDGQ